jgi:hypothetical protein
MSEFLREFFDGFFFGLFAGITLVVWLYLTAKYQKEVKK